MTWRVILGTVSLVLTTILLGFVAVTEPSRMEGFTRAYETRQIEVGATLFEGRCITCHGVQGQGIEGVAPDITIELPAGDAATGKALAEGKGCTACHVTAAVGPAWLASADPNGEGVGARAEKRFTGADYTGKAASAQQYLFESIVLPGPTWSPAPV